MSLFNYIGHGPLWGFDEVDRLPCDRFWWHNLLYINNFQTLQDQVTYNIFKLLQLDWVLHSFYKNGTPKSEQ